MAGELMVLCTSWSTIKYVKRKLCGYWGFRFHALPDFGRLSPYTRWAKQLANNAEGITKETRSLGSVFRAQHAAHLLPAGN